MEWSTSCPDWEQRIVAGRSLIPCAPLFPEEAAHALETFTAFRVVDLPGAPTVGEIARPWIIEFASVFFGAYDPESGRRLISTYYLKVPKKNWKSGIAAFLMGTLLIRNWRESGEFGIIAPTTEVANNAFGPLKHAIRKDEELSDLLHVQDHVRTITHRTTKASLQVVAAESDTVSGKKFAVTLVEELWQFGKRHNAEAMLLEATGGMASREEGATIYITTESDEQPAGVYAAKNLYARKVRDGEIVDPTFLPVLYEWPRQMVERGEHLDLANAHIVNPNLGASVSETFLRSKHAETKAESDRAFQAFCAKHLNVEIGVGLLTDRWSGVDFWKARADASITFESLLRRSEVVAVGIDGGGHEDLYGFCAAGWDRASGQMLSWSCAYALPIVLERRKEIAPRLRDLEKNGDLVMVRVIEEACEHVVALIRRIDSAGKLGALQDGKRKAIGVDPAGIKQTLDALNAAGYPSDVIVPVSQGWRLGSSIKSTELYLSSGTLIHADQPMMDWAVGNAKIESKGNAVLITKQKSGSAKIDPLMALFNAVEILSLNPTVRASSVYEQMAAERREAEGAEA